MTDADMNPGRLAQLLNEGFGTDAAVTPEGVLHLRTQDGLAVAASLSPDGQDLVFHAALAALDGPRDVVRLVTALACNLHQEDTRGGAIGLDLGTLTLVYCWRRPAAACGDEVALRALASFCDTAELLARRLAESVADFDTGEMEQMAQHMASLEAAFAGAADLDSLQVQPAPALAHRLHG